MQIYFRVKQNFSCGLTIFETWSIMFNQSESTWHSCEKRKQCIFSNEFLFVFVWFVFATKIQPRLCDDNRRHFSEYFLNFVQCSTDNLTGVYLFKHTSSKNMMGRRGGGQKHLHSTFSQHSYGKGSIIEYSNSLYIQFGY